MLGSKPLSNLEIGYILKELRTKRNQCLFILGLRTGFRISELLSLKISDCLQYNEVRDEITVSRSNTKGKQVSRTVVLHSEAKRALKDYLRPESKLDQPLFPFTRQQAHRILKRAVERAKIKGKVSTHSMRKSFAQSMYERLGYDLVNTQRALGHKNVNSTISYLSFNQDLINKAIKGE